MDNTLTIEELTGPKRSIQLTGGGMPHGGSAAWKGEQKVKTTWYPGNGAEATQHVLGPSDAPARWEGTWRRNLLSRTPAVVSDDSGTRAVTVPYVLVEAMDAIRYAGARLRVTWATSTGTGKPVTVVREGRLTEFEWTPERSIDDIKWTCNFDWMGRGLRSQKVVATRGSSADNAQAAFDTAANDMVGFWNSLPMRSKAKSLPLSANSLSLGQLEALANYPAAVMGSAMRSVQQLTGRIARIVGIGKTIATVPAAVANAAVNQARNVLATANNTIDTLASIPAELTSTSDNVHEMLRSANAVGQYHDRMRTLADRAHDYIVKQARPAAAAPGSVVGNTASGARDAEVRDLLAVHVVHEGDTPLTLARRYYHNPDNAIDILRANRLPWQTVQLEPGTVLIVPVLQSRKA